MDLQQMRDGASYGARSLVLLLALALLASSLIAYRAVRAQRLHRARAEATLDDYALFGAWELSRNAEEQLRHSLNMTLWPVNRLGSQVADSLPAPAVLEDAQGREIECDCPLPLAARYYFRLDLRTGVLDSGGEKLPPTLAGTLMDLAEVRLGSSMSPHWRGMLMEVPVGAERHLVAAAALPDGRGAPRALYGLAVDPASLAPLFRAVVNAEPLLPRSLASDRPGDSLLVTSLRMADGRELWRSPGPGSDHRAAQVLPETLAGLEVEVALRADALADLGAVPDSETPLLLLLLLGMAVLFALAARDLKRRAELVMLRSDFVSSVSHELRTPLAQIRMFGETLLMKRERSEEERMQFLRIVQEEAERLTHLVDNVLRFARVQRGSRDAPTTAPREVSGLIASVARGFRPLAESSGAELETHLPDELWVRTDPEGLRQILLNLLDNALKYGPAGQTIRMGARAGGDGETGIWVEDEGPGVAESERDRIFRPFTRGSGHGNAVSGTGIGLTVARVLAEEQGGSIQVRESSGGGSRFIVRLPRAAPGPAPHEPRPPE